MGAAEERRWFREVMATGAIHAYLLKECEVENIADERDLATNELWVTVPFLDSRFRVTVTMDPDDGLALHDPWKV